MWKEKIFKRLFIAGDRLKVLKKWLEKFCRICFSVTNYLFLIIFIYYIGFLSPEDNIDIFAKFFRLTLFILTVSKFLPELLTIEVRGIISNIFRILLFLFTMTVILTNFHILDPAKSLWANFYGNTIVIIAIFLIVISEISRLFEFISRINIPPALIFSGSFLIIIFVGAGLLMLPNSRYVPVSLIDSLFTSVSAVCVTGLVVVNTATSFTLLGKTIILGLIQIGGLGIMTFTGFFGYIFTTSTSFRTRLLLKDIFTSESISNLFKLLTKIILITFLTEIIGALIIYTSLSEDSENMLFFSIFHSVSAFCNAGFSTLTDGMYTYKFRENYSFQLTIAFLIILGGIGFPVLLKVYKYAKHIFMVFIRLIQSRRAPVLQKKSDLNARLVLITTGILIIAGMAGYYFLEKDSNMAGMNSIQMGITSFFGSVSARTAGFNIIDISLWSYPTVFLMIVLMWIGASPGSTGGGIKTTTFAIAIMSAISNIRGHRNLIIGNREIGTETISRILSIIFLSFIVISAGFFGLLLTESGKEPVHLFFECVSAFSTVGLSLADTSTFSHTGKVIITIMMFIGRVGPLTLLTGFFLSDKKIYQRYPVMDIIIN